MIEGPPHVLTTCGPSKLEEGGGLEPTPGRSMGGELKTLLNIPVKIPVKKLIC